MPVDRHGVPVSVGSLVRRGPGFPSEVLEIRDEDGADWAVYRNLGQLFASRCRELEVVL